MSTHSTLSVSPTVPDLDEIRVEPHRPPGAKTAAEKGLVAGETRHQVAVARLEYQPRFAGKLGVATTQGARLRIAFSGAGLRCHH